MKMFLDVRLKGAGTVEIAGEADWKDYYSLWHTSNHSSHQAAFKKLAKRELQWFIWDLPRDVAFYPIFLDYCAEESDAYAIAFHRIVYEYEGTEEDCVLLTLASTLQSGNESVDCTLSASKPDMSHYQGIPKRFRRT